MPCWRRGHTVTDGSREGKGGRCGRAWAEGRTGLLSLIRVRRRTPLLVVVEDRVYRSRREDWAQDGGRCFDHCDGHAACADPVALLMAVLLSLLPHRHRATDPPRGSLAWLQVVSPVDTRPVESSAESQGRFESGGGDGGRGLAGAVGHGRRVRDDGMDPDRWTALQVPRVPRANTVGEHAGSTGRGGTQGDHEYFESYREGHSLLNEVTRGTEAEEKGGGLFGREKLTTVEGSGPRVRGHAMVGYEEAELEGQLAAVNELFCEFEEGAWQTETEDHLGEKEKPEFPPQPPTLWWDSRRLEEPEGGLAAFITRRKKNAHKTIEGEKKEEKEKPRGAVGAMVGDRPHRHEGLKRKAEVSSRRQDLPQAPRVQVPGRTNQKWRKAIQTARCFRANKGRHMDSLKDFKRAYYANSSRKAKASIRRTVNKILANLGVKGLRECWSVHVLEQVGAVLRSSEYKAGVTYLAEYKNMLIEKGESWTHQLQHAFIQASRALKRARGPAKKAMEVEQDRWMEAYRREQNEATMGPVHNPALMFAFATTWMLREVELAAIHKEDIMIEPKERIVSLTLRISKGDQEALGLKRTLQCDCQECDWSEPCPFNISKAALDNTPIEVDKIAHGDDEGEVEKSQIVGAWRKLFGSKVSGHSGRRTGALQYIRRGWHVPQVAYLGRWKSNVILQYAEEALETMPVMARTRKIMSTPPSKTEIMTQMAKETDTKAIEKMKETGAKLKKEIDQLKMMQDKLDESIDRWKKSPFGTKVCFHPW